MPIHFFRLLATAPLLANEVIGFSNTGLRPLRDLTPEIAGLPRFAHPVPNAPDSAITLIAFVVYRLGLRNVPSRSCFYHLLMALSGWRYARHLRWTEMNDIFLVEPQLRGAVKGPVRSINQDDLVKGFHA